MRRPSTCLLVFLSGLGLLLADEPLEFEIDLTTASNGFDGERCWVHARAGTIPAEALGDESEKPLVVMTTQKLLLSGSDVFYALNQLTSDDLGASWTDPIPQNTFIRQRLEADSDALPTGAEIAPSLLQPGDETTVCDFVPAWHRASQRLLGIGQTVWYRNNRVMHVRPRGIAYSVFNTNSRQWRAWQTVQLPDELKFQCAGSGSQQRVDLVGGDILLPFYFKEPKQRQYSVTVARCRFDGHRLHYLKHGSELTVPIKRGLYEPSITRFGGRFYLTMRNDDCGYVSSSKDGLTFAEPKKWAFDDGRELGNYNTQQHWVTHSSGLYLVYTRRGADNDHVFRHRAPLFIARVDPESLRVIRSSERVLVLERGARLGNFGVVDVSPHETWVTVTEWMQPRGVEKHGSDNSIFVAKLKWNSPNLLVTSDAEPVTPAQSDSAWPEIKEYFSPPPEYSELQDRYPVPLRFSDGSVVQTPADWQRRRTELLDEWTDHLGTWPDLITDPEVEILATQRSDGLTKQRIRFHWTPNETTTGYLLTPSGAGPRPAVVTVFYEPETAIGEGTSKYRDFAIQLARRGFVALSIGTTDATAAREYALYYPSIEDAHVAPLSMLGCAAANAWHVLAKQPSVDPARIGIVGHSFGGKWGMFAACLFDRFACAAWSDPGIVFDDSRPSVNYWEPWYLGYHPKPWRRRGLITTENPARGLYPRLREQGVDLHELHALMAPRPFLVSGGSEDPIERWNALNSTVAVNRVLGFENRVAMTNRPDHSPNPDSNEVIYKFFQHFLIDEAQR